MVRKLKNIAHAWESNLASFFYGRPAKKIFTIGVTGTDGKTTTASLIFHILKTAGFKPSMITTVAAQIGEEIYDTGLHTTTPSAFTLQKYIRRAVDAKSDYLVLEVTSHALDQNRVDGVNFKIGVLTNITHDHLDYHRTRQAYIEAKSKLFSLAETAVLNKDDSSFGALKKILQNKHITTYSIHDKNDLKLPKLTSFNASNFLAAAKVARVLGIDNAIIQRALLNFKLPEGRQEIAYDSDFRIVIDFAHTPNAFENILSEIKKNTRGKLIHVFGSAGQRDKSKRPLMGEISSRYSDIIILTIEDSRSEKVEDINAQIKIGMKDFKGELVEIRDRQEAINFAVRKAQKGDTVIITGKGHEKSMNLGRGEEPWSDHEAVRKAVSRK